MKGRLGYRSRLKRSARFATLVCLLAASTAYTPVVRADPLALRHGVDGRDVRVLAGLPEVSVAAPLQPTKAQPWQLAATLRLPHDSLSLWLGRIEPLMGSRHGTFVDASYAAGLILPTANLGASAGGALGVTGSVQVGWRCDGFAHTWTLAAPLAVGWTTLGGTELRLPLRAEVALRWRFDRVWVGVQAGAGAVWTPDLDIAADANIAVFWAFPLG